VSDRSPLNDAKALLAQNGSLSEAALLLEAAIQKGDLGEGGYEAWILLGETRNMDEREEAGMRALVEGVRRAEEAGKTGEGMMVYKITFNSFKMYSPRMVSLLQSHTPTSQWIKLPMSCFSDGYVLASPTSLCRRTPSRLWPLTLLGTLTAASQSCF